MFLVFYVTASLNAEAIEETSSKSDSNDATWDETTEFIRKNLHFIDRQRIFICDRDTYGLGPKLYESKRTNHYFEDRNNVKDSKLILTFYGTSISDDDVYEYSIQLDKLIKIDLEFYDGFMNYSLSTTGKNIMMNHEENHCAGLYSGSSRYLETKRAVSRIEFGTSDKDMRMRLFRAFNHLVSLAEREREIIRENSGDKF